MLNKLQKLYTSSLARIDPKLSNIIGKMKLLWMKQINYIIRILRFFKRIALSAGSLTVTTIFLLLFYIIVQLWGFTNGKYSSWLDGLWDMKATFITTIGIGLVSLSVNEQNNWRAKLKVQYGFRMAFTSVEQVMSDINRTFLVDQQIINDLNKEYARIQNKEAVQKNIDKSELDLKLKILLEISEHLLEKINFTELAVDQKTIQLELSYLNSEIREFISKPTATDTNYLYMFNKLNFSIHTIANRLSSPWRWDKDRKQKYYKIIEKYKINKE